MGNRQIVVRRAARYSRLSFPCLVAVLCLWMLSRQIDRAMLSTLPSEMAQLPILHILCAMSFSMISLWAVGRYDGVAHRHLQIGIMAGPARLTGSIAIALSQTLGFGLFTSAIARWRMLPSLSFTDAFRLSAFVCLSFLSSWAVITAFVCLVLPAPAWTTWPAVGLIICLPIMVLPIIGLPRIKLGTRYIKLPSLVACGAILFWATIDLGTAAAALYFLIPSADLAFLTLLPVFLIALGAALLSGTPGGVGPFELVMLGLLPHVPAAELLAGIVGFRVVYYAAPAILAMITMLRPFSATSQCHAAPPSNIADSRRAEIGVIRQNGGALIGFASGAIAIWPTPQTLTALGDPIDASPQIAIKSFTQHALDQNRIPCLYKCSAKTALVARRLSWSVIHYADDALLNPATFDLATPTRRALRRKLRQAEQATVTTQHAQNLPLRDMATIDANWQHRNGPARGGTMGRYSPAYVAGQQVFLAYQQDRLIAFISFHHTKHQWCLDLMRSTSGAPDGTMHALVTHALRHAADRNIPQVSLAATPACPDPSSRLMRAFAMQVVARSGGPGLRQFKSSFAPRWQPLYVATRSHTTMAIALADIAREVHHPLPLTPSHNIHNKDENNEVALRLAS